MQRKFTVSAIICAAGKGERAGFEKNKLLTPLFGAPALYHTFKKFDIAEIGEVIVAAAKQDMKEISAIAAPFGYKVVRGGKTRTESVKCALKSVTGDIVIVHDGARPYVTKEIILRCIKSAETFGSGVCAIPCTDTTVYAQYGEITDRMDRSILYRVQTPQAFLTEDLRRAYRMADEREYTDDSSVYGEFIAPARIVEGDESNKKLTFKSDFPREYPLLSAVDGIKIGYGADVHAFGEGTFVTLGGIKIECGRALVAHSDGDVVLHAVMDAVLSAAGLKDIGHYFPPEDEKFAGADSAKMLKETLKLAENAGYAPINFSITVQAEQPRLAPHIDEIVENIADICGVDKENCAVAAGTCEHLGFVGEGLGIAAYCAVILKEI